ncbi:E3 ubiquitin-protein ligase siah-1-like [Choristoneura fumiferana]|uniref:E3 ubiquitin-protein ligase siah-1-like n=1 Tax=Choristoneura fumiferana TaxID=7141 RepID=UPI003D15E159
MSASAVDVPECPVCLETLTAPILQCQGGHSLCSACSSALAPPNCPICRKPMTSMRNWTLEDIIEKAASAARAAAARGAPARAVKRACANAAAGCAYVFTAARDAEDHGRECIFRDMLCPLNAAFNNCFWIGKLKQMMDHFKQKHPSNCLVPGSETEVRGVREGHSARNVWLVAQGNMHFIVSMKTDPDGVDWVVQHIGSKKNANLYIYEIHVISKQDAARRAVFAERCTSDAEAADASFGAGRCAALPPRLVPHFAREGTLAFRFSVRKMPPAALAPNITNLTLV